MHCRVASLVLLFLIDVYSPSSCLQFTFVSPPGCHLISIYILSGYVTVLMEWLISLMETFNNSRFLMISFFFFFLADIIEKALLSANHTFTRIDGSMNWKQREDAMVKFSSDACDSFEAPRFILCSLMACGTGITLTRGNHVFMVRAVLRTHSR